MTSLRRAAPLLLAAVLVAACAGRHAPEPAEPAGARLHVLYFNDWHGHLEPFVRDGVERGGAARLVHLIEARRAAIAAAGDDSLLLVAGDILQGTPMSTMFRGEPDFAILDRLGVTASSLGNHEFDFGLPVLEQRAAEVGFPLLAANVRWRDGRPFGRGSLLVTTPRHGLRVAILGLVTAETRYTTHPRNVEELEFEDPVAVARREVPALAEGADLVVVLSHSGEATDRLLAEVAGVDLVIGGHDQRRVEARGRRGVPVLQAGEWGERIGEVVFAGAEGGLRYAGNRFHEVTADLPEDEATARFVAGYREKLGAAMRREVGSTAVALDGDRSRVRRQETNFGNLVADAVREGTGADVALINGGAIRASIDAGPVTAEELLTALPFDNQLVVVELSGRELQAMLDRSATVALDGGGGGGFLQVSGLTYRIDRDGASDVRVAGGPLRPGDRYRIATTDFLAAGGDGHVEALGKAQVQTGYVLHDLVLQWIERQGAVAAEVEGRIVVDDVGREAA